MSVISRFQPGSAVGLKELNILVDAINLVDDRVPDVSKWWTWNGVDNGRHYDNKTGQKKMLITSGHQLVKGPLTPDNSKLIPIKFGITFNETPAVVATAHGKEVIRVGVLTSSLTVNGFTAYITQDDRTTQWLISAISYIAIGV